MIQRWQSLAISETGLVRAENQDNFFINDETQLWLVADGMGGGESGALASKMIVDAFESVEVAESLATLFNQLERVLQTVSRDIFHYAETELAGKSMGSTVVLLCKWRNLGVLIWAGDSRCYGYSHGNFESLTWDHNQATELMKMGKLTQDEYAQLPRTNIITRAVGAHQNLYIDCKLLDLSHFQRLMLCSDGISSEVTDDQLSELFRSESNPEKMLSTISEMTLAAGAKDNFTCVLLSAQGVPYKPLKVEQLTRWNSDLEATSFAYYLGDIDDRQYHSQLQDILEEVDDSIPNPHKEPTLRISQAVATEQPLEGDISPAPRANRAFLSVILAIILILIFTGFQLI
ncbi:PP2C family protein-serine/threonine phosphatase [Thalassotalea euphylliae]|uniref:PP2C family protein-serine/threonine phosphatase n=1 Tax=Thalassotalea euphylliae TaxID=1655234 RepID=UPI0015F290B7|nr:protein phosphatase 2C domain-containing protein [Thalassotalea euphylliae]